MHLSNHKLLVLNQTFLRDRVGQPYLQLVVSFRELAQGNLEIAGDSTTRFVVVLGKFRLARLTKQGSALKEGNRKIEVGLLPLWQMKISLEEDVERIGRSKNMGHIGDYSHLINNQRVLRIASLESPRSGEVLDVAVI